MRIDAYAIGVIDEKLLDNIYLDIDVFFDRDVIKVVDQDSDNLEEHGYIVHTIDDVWDVQDDFGSLIKTNLAPNYTNRFTILNGTQVDFYDVAEGRIVYMWGNKVLIYLGVMDIDDDTYLVVPAEDVFDECLSNYYLLDTYEEYIEDFCMCDECMEQLASEPKLTCACEEREEKNTMDNLFGSLGFGKIKGDRFKLSMNGIAVAQNNGKYVVYNKDNNEFVDVSNMLFDIKDALFLLPAVEVNAGDTVLHEGKPYFVVDTANEIKAVDYETCTQTVLIPKSTMFGIKYFQKVFSMFGDNFAVAGDLFSNPMMLMALMEGKNSDLTQLMLFNSMSKGDLGSNPMALAMMLKGDKSDDSLSTIALMSMFNNGTNPFVAPKQSKAKKSNE